MMAVISISNINRNCFTSIQGINIFLYPGFSQDKFFLAKKFPNIMTRMIILAVTENVGIVVIIINTSQKFYRVFTRARFPTT